MRQRGSIILRNGRYCVKYRTDEGRQKWESGFSTKADARRRLTEILGQFDNGSYSELSGLTLPEFADHYLKVKEISVKGATAHTYECALNRYIKPFFAGKRLSKVRLEHVNDFIAYMKGQQYSGSPLATAYIDKIVTVLSGLYKYAVKTRQIRINPVLGAEKTKRIKGKVQAPSRDDVHAILEAASPQTKTLFLMEVTSGLRRGEMLALHWSDIDWLKGEVLVERAVVKARSKDGLRKWAWVIGSTKGGQTRSVALPEMVRDALREWKRVSAPQSENTPIFTRNGTYISPEYFTTHISRRQRVEG